MDITNDARTLTPTSVMLLAYYLFSAEPWPDLSPPHIQYAVNFLTENQLLVWSRSENVQCLKITNRGRCFVEYVLRLPLPKQKWIMEELHERPTAN